MIKLFTHTDLDGVGCNIVASVVYSESKQTIKSILDLILNPQWDYGWIVS